MQIIIFLIEVVLIFFLVDMDKLSTFKNKKAENISYTSYYEFDDFGNSILVLDTLSKEEKVIVWKNSAIKEEMMLEFPNIYNMSEIIKKRVEDNGTFKRNLVDYIEYIQGKYLSGEITQDEFRDKLNNPNPLLPCY